MILDEVSNQINELIVGQPKNKNKSRKHIGKVILEAEKYRQYLLEQSQKAKEAGWVLYDENKDTNEWTWSLNAYNDICKHTYFTEDERFCKKEMPPIQFYIKGKPEPNPLDYLNSMIWGSVGQVYEGFDILDYQFVLLAIIHDAQNWQAGRERIYFNRLGKTSLADRLCYAVWNRLIEESHGSSYGFRNIENTINTAMRAVKVKLDTEEKSTLVKDTKSTKEIWESIKSEYDISRREFGKKINFVKDPFKRKILFRDVEQAFVLASQGFSKPAIILAGGVIEELLRLYLEHKNIQAQGDKFFQYIDACEKKGIMKPAISKLTDSVRDFRNLVHLKNEKEKRHTISMATAKGAVSSIFTIANDFQ
jgi:hypothetical protein